MFNTSLLPEKEISLETKTMLRAAVNGWVMFSGSYFFVYLVSQYAAAFVATYVYGIKTSVHLTGLEFVLGGKEWVAGNVVPVFLASPAVAFGLSIFLLVLLFRLELVGTIWKQFCFWGVVHGLNLSLGTVICGVLTQEGTWFALRWMSLPDLFVISLAVLALVTLLVAGRFSAVLLFMSCDSLTLMKAQNRNFLLFGMLVLPYLAGAFFLLLFKFPVSYYDLLLMFGSLLFILLPLFSKGRRMLVNDRVNAPQRTVISWELVSLLMVVAFVARFVI